MNKNFHSREAALKAAKIKLSRKRTSAFACLALAGALTVGGAIAFIATMSDKAENSFLPTRVTCEVVENGGAFPWGSTLKEDVRVKNTSTTDAFIRAEIVVNWVKVGANNEVVNVLGVAPTFDDYSITLANGTGWSAEMADGFYYFNGKVAPGDVTGQLIATCEPQAPAPVDGYVLRVDVVAEAIQAAGADGDKTPVDAWDNAFVDITRNSDGSAISVINRSGQDA